jgi:uncharacterized repeat protein (TIGR01451 family)
MQQIFIKNNFKLLYILYSIVVVVMGISISMSIANTELAQSASQVEVEKCMADCVNSCVNGGCNSAEVWSNGWRDACVNGCPGKCSTMCSDGDYTNNCKNNDCGQNEGGGEIITDKELREGKTYEQRSEDLDGDGNKSGKIINTSKSNLPKTCVPDKVYCARDFYGVNPTENNSQGIGIGVKCNKSGTGYLQPTGYDACAPREVSYLQDGQSCKGLTRLSYGEASRGEFVGCRGALNCFCKDPRINNYPASDWETAITGSGLPGTRRGKIIEFDGNVVCYEDYLEDSCAASAVIPVVNTTTSSRSVPPPPPPPPQCNELCNNNCPGNLSCISIGGQNRCRLAENPNSPSCQPVVDRADFMIQKDLINSTSQFFIGDVVTFRIRITNTGNTTFTNIAFRDQFDPLIIRYVTGSVARFSSDNVEIARVGDLNTIATFANGRFSIANLANSGIGVLAPNQYFEFNLRYIVNAPSGYQNTCNVAYAQPSGLVERSDDACLTTRNRDTDI